MFGLALLSSSLGFMQGDIANATYVLGTCSVIALLPGLIFLYFGMKLARERMFLQRLASFLMQRQRASVDDVAAAFQLGPLDAEDKVVQALNEGHLRGNFDKGTRQFFTEGSQQNMEFLPKCGVCGASIGLWVNRTAPAKCQYCGSEPRPNFRPPPPPAAPALMYAPPGTLGAPMPGPYQYGMPSAPPQYGMPVYGAPVPGYGMPAYGAPVPGHGMPAYGAPLPGPGMPAVSYAQPPPAPAGMQPGPPPALAGGPPQQPPMTAGVAPPPSSFPVDGTGQPPPPSAYLAGAPPAPQAPAVGGYGPALALGIQAPAQPPPSTYPQGAPPPPPAAPRKKRTIKFLFFSMKSGALKTVGYPLFIIGVMFLAAAVFISPDFWMGPFLTFACSSVLYLPPLLIGGFLIYKGRKEEKYKEQLLDIVDYIETYRRMPIDLLMRKMALPEDKVRKIIQDIQEFQLVEGYLTGDGSEFIICLRKEDVKVVTGCPYCKATGLYLNILRGGSEKCPYCSGVIYFSEGG